MTATPPPGSRSDGKDGTSYSLDTFKHEGPTDTSAAVAAVVAYWKRLGLAVEMPDAAGQTPSTATLFVGVRTSTGAVIEVGAGTDGIRFSGESGCASVGGSPAPLPSATSPPAGSGTPVTDGTS